MHVYMLLHTYTHVNIYICETHSYSTEKGIDADIYVYLCIYTHMHIYMCIYIHVYIPFI